jgi:hypothetical protein
MIGGSEKFILKSVLRSTFYLMTSSTANVNTEFSKNLSVPSIFMNFVGHFAMHESSADLHSQLFGMTIGGFIQLLIYACGRVPQ